MDVVTTTGKGNGHQMPPKKAKIIANNIGDVPMAVASGITLENCELYKDHVNSYMVASCIAN